MYVVMSKIAQLSQKSKQSLDEVKNQGNLGRNQKRQLSSFFHAFDNVIRELDDVKPVIQQQATQYAKSIYFAHDSITETKAILLKSLTEAGINEIESNSLISKLKPPKAEVRAAGVADNTDTVENQGDNSVEAMAEALKLLAPKLGIVKDALDALNLTESGIEQGDKPSGEAQIELANILQNVLKEVESEQQRGRLTSQKQVSDYIGLRFTDAVVNSNLDESSSIQITQADIRAFSEKLGVVTKTCDGTANEEEQHKMMDLILNHKGFLLGLVAMVSKPLAKMFASLPFGIGAPFNFLLAQVHSNIGPILTAAITGAVMKDRPNTRAA